MSKLLRGEYLNIESPKDDFTKIPNWLIFNTFPKDITLADRMIMIGLYGYCHKKGYKLPLTRLAAELDIDKSNLIYRLKYLFKKNYLLHVDGNLEINIGRFSNQISRGSTTLIDNKVGYSNQEEHEQGGVDLPNKIEVGSSSDQGRILLPSKVGYSNTLGGVDPPIEEDRKKEKKKDNKTTENSEPNNEGHSWFKSPTPVVVQKRFKREEFDYSDYLLNQITNPNIEFGMLFNQRYDGGDPDYGYIPMDELKSIPFQKRMNDSKFNKVIEVYNQVITIIEERSIKERINSN